MDKPSGSWVQGKEIDGELWIRAADAHIQKEASLRDLRDYFAAKAMQSMYKIYYKMFLEGTFEEWHTEGMMSLAENAYCMADAMLQEREK